MVELMCHLAGESAGDVVDCVMRRAGNPSHRARNQTTTSTESWGWMIGRTLEIAFIRSARVIHSAGSASEADAWQALLTTCRKSR
jgi:hypothetical protein